MKPINRLREEYKKAKKDVSHASQFSNYYAIRAFALDTETVSFKEAELMEHEVDAEIEAEEAEPLEMTLDNLNEALTSYFWLIPKKEDLINRAVALGYVRRLSHTQAQWTEQGVNEFK